MPAVALWTNYGPTVKSCLLTEIPVAKICTQGRELSPSKHGVSYMEPYIKQFTLIQTVSDAHPHV